MREGLREMIENEAQRAESEGEDENGDENGPEDAVSDSQTLEASGQADTPADPSEGESGPQAHAAGDVDKNMKRLEAEAQRHAKRVSEIMGDDALILQPCPRCWPVAPGFIMPGMPVEDEQRREVKLSIGEQPIPQYNEARDKRRCDDCDGWGRTLTGARETAQVDLPCSGCNGQGWKVNLGANAIAPGASANGPASSGIPGTTAHAGPPDVWGRPSGHPHWGVAPATVGV